MYSLLATVLTHKCVRLNKTHKYSVSAPVTSIDFNNDKLT